MSPRAGAARRAIARAFAIACASLVAAPQCNGVLGITSLSVADEAGGGDAAGGGGATGDGGGDASSGGGDGGDVGDADAGGPFCAGVSAGVAACEDFDGEQGYEADGWVTPGSPLGEHGFVDTAVFRSSPRALTVTTPALADAYGQWCIKHSFAGSSRVALSFAVRLDTYDPDPNDGYVILADVGLAGAAPGGGAHASFAVDHNGAHILVSTPAFADRPLATPPLTLGAWARVEVDIVRTGDDAVVSVELDGAPLAFVDGATHLAVTGAGDTTVTVGACYVSAHATPQTVHVDDILVDLR